MGEPGTKEILSLEELEATGVIAAPVFYAYIKDELRARELI